MVRKDGLDMTNNNPSASCHRGRAPLLSQEQCQQIASEFDGTTKTIDEKSLNGSNDP